jgi:hypothetical protein
MLKNNTASQNDQRALALGQYAPISLSKMNDVALLDRTDTKYVLPVATLQQIMPELVNAYYVLVVNKKRRSQYQTLYFDSPEFALYRRHHAGILDRYKVRSREYVDSQLAFLEVKHKTNKGRTVKSRVRTPELVTTLPGETAEFLRGAYPYDVAELEPKLWVEYTRTTLVSRNHRERVTIDLDLGYAWNGQTISLPHVAIVEVKRDALSHQSEIERHLHAHQVRPTGFSKYCIGVSLLYPGVKHNNFKPKLRLVERLGGSHVHVH